MSENIDNLIDKFYAEVEESVANAKNRLNEAIEIKETNIELLDTIMQPIVDTLTYEDMDSEEVYKKYIDYLGSFSWPAKRAAQIQLETICGYKHHITIAALLVAEDKFGNKVPGDFFHFAKQSDNWINKCAGILSCVSRNTENPNYKEIVKKLGEKVELVKTLDEDRLERLCKITDDYPSDEMHELSSVDAKDIEDALEVLDKALAETDLMQRKRILSDSVIALNIRLSMLDFERTSTVLDGENIEFEILCENA